MNVPLNVLLEKNGKHRCLIEKVFSVWLFEVTILFHYSYLFHIILY